MDLSLFTSAYEGLKLDFLLSHTAYCRDVLKLKRGQRAVISNGRVSHRNKIHMSASMANVFYNYVHLHTVNVMISSL